MPRTVHAVDAATAAKHLGIGRNTLLERLRNAGVTHRSGQCRNLPRKEYRDAGLFSTALTEYQQGPVKHLYEKLTITAAGMNYCRDLLSSNDELGTDRQKHTEKPQPNGLHDREKQNSGRSHLRELWAALNEQRIEHASDTQQRRSSKNRMPATR